MIRDRNRLLAALLHLFVFFSPFGVNEEDRNGIVSSDPCTYRFSDRGSDAVGLEELIVRTDMKFLETVGTCL